MVRKKHIFVFILFFVFFIRLSAQEQNETKKIKILNAREAVYDENSSGQVRKLIGDVRFKQEDVLMFCDSAYLYALSNTLYAYSNVRILQGDTLSIVSDSLKYYGDTRLAELRGNIVLKNPEQTLTTNYLDYYIKENYGYYAGGGKIINNENKQTLESKRGYYYANTKSYLFVDNVKLNDPEYRIESDSLQHFSIQNLSKFYGPTYIYSDSTTIYCERGWYDKTLKKAEFVCNAKIISKENTIESDSINYNMQTEIAEMFKDVVITDTLNKVKVYGDYGYYHSKDSISLVTGHLLLVQEFEDDTLFMHGDTLFAAPDSNHNQRIQVYHKVKFFKKDLQGKCDSLTMSQSDSLIRMFYDPVIWSEENQIAGVHIQIKNYDGIIDWMHITEKAFIASELDTSKYNQIKGRVLFAYFKENQIYKVDVDGNGQTLYYAKEEDESIFGMNKLDCSNMTLYLDSNQIETIHFYSKPKATLYPLKDLTPDIQFFNDFKWRHSERPLKPEDVFIRDPEHLTEQMEAEKTLETTKKEP